MVLKIIFLVAVIYFLYRLFGGRILPKKKENKDIEDENTLVECCKCGIYITKKEAVKKFDKYYCNECA
jgi:late competence protein required for DNA uptake (superfamily II DNA/RNA helicase)